MTAAVEAELFGGDAQQLDAGTYQWLAEFFELSSDRHISVGMGIHIGPIPAASIERASARYPGEEDAFRQCIRAMDRVYLNYSRAPADKRHRVDKSRTFGPDIMRGLGK